MIPCNFCVWSSVLASIYKCINFFFSTKYHIVCVLIKYYYCVFTYLWSISVLCCPKKYIFRHVSIFKQSPLQLLKRKTAAFVFFEPITKAAPSSFFVLDCRKAAVCPTALVKYGYKCREFYSFHVIFDYSIFENHFPIRST